MAALVAATVSSFYMIWREGTLNEQEMAVFSKKMAESQAKQESYMRQLCAYEQRLPDLKSICKGELR